MNGTTFGSGVGNGSAGWNGGIWSNSAIGSGLKSGSTDNGRVLGGYNCSRGFSAGLADSSLGDISNSAHNNNEPVTGSGSLLSSSELDSYSGRHATPWKSVDDPSSGHAKVHSNHTNTSPMHRQTSTQLTSQGFYENPTANPSYFSAPSASLKSSNKQAQSQFLDPTSSIFVTSNVLDSTKIGRSSRHNSDEEIRPSAKSLAFGGMDGGLSIQPGRQNFLTNFSSHNSSSASRSGSMPPSRHEAHQPASRFVDDIPRQQNPSLASASSHRPNLSVQGSIYPTNGVPISQRYNTTSSSTDLGGLAGNFDKLNLGRGNQTMQYQNTREMQHPADEFSDIEYARQSNGSQSNEMWAMDDVPYVGSHQFSSEGLGSGILPSHEHHYRNNAYGASYSHSPSNSEARRSQHSPYYSSVGTPSSYQQRAPSRGSSNGAVAPGQAALLDRKLRGLQQEQQGYLASQPNPLHYRPPMPQHYDFHPQHALRMNPLAAYYPMAPMPTLLNPSIPRGPARDQDIGQHLRSALLEEFRSNSKTNKRYELKVGIRGEAPRVI